MLTASECDRQNMWGQKDESLKTGIRNEQLLINRYYFFPSSRWYSIFTTNSSVKTVAVCGSNADGSRAVTGSADGTARLWDANLGAELLVFEGHTHQVQAASISADGSLVVTGSYDQTAKVWNANTGTKVLSCLTPLVLS
jgi:WD40 repeat protein